VITATVVGLLGVLEFHPKSSTLSLGSLPAAGTAATSAACPGIPTFPTTASG